MQGRKEFTPRLFYELSLESLVPGDNFYHSSETKCKNCPLRVRCCGKKTKFKKIDDSIHKEHYDRMHRKLTENPREAKKLSRIRGKTVEPVLGTLLNFLSMRRVNTRGIKLANKHVLMASLTYNLKKYLKFVAGKTKSAAQAAFFSKSTPNFLENLLFWPEYQPPSQLKVPT